MTRRRKLVLLLVVAPLALLLLLVVAALTPAVQTFVVRRVLSGQGSVEHVSVGTGGAEIRGLVLDQAGVKFAVPSVRAALPLAAAAGGKISVHALVARDVVIDYDLDAAADYAKKHPAVAGEKSPATPFEGLLKLVTLPELQVDGLDFSGVLHVTGATPLTANFTLTGGGISAGKEGRIELKITAAADKTADVVTTLALLPTLDASGQLSALALKLDATANSRLLPKPVVLLAEAGVTREGNGEQWSLRLTSSGKQLVGLDSRWAPGASSLPGHWKLDLADSDLAPFLPFLVLPKLALAGGGDLALSGSDRLQISGDLKFDADALERLAVAPAYRPVVAALGMVAALEGVNKIKLPALGPVSLATKFDVEASAAAASVKAFRLDVAAAAVPVLAVESKQAFTYALATRTLASANPASELISVRLLSVPPAWIASFVPDLALGGAVTGAWNARPEGDGLVLSSAAPLALNTVRYGPAASPLVAFDLVQVDGLRARLGPAGLEATVEKLRLAASGADLVAGKLSASQKPGAPLSAHAELNAQLAALADQPVLRGQTRLSAGQALLILDATLAETKKATAEIRLSGLRAAGADLPGVVLQAEVTQDAAGVLNAKLPLTVENASPKRTSDLEITATVTPGATGQRIVAKVLSQILHVSDLEAFAAIASDAPAAAKPAGAPETTGPAKPVSTPLWKGVTGELGLSLARIVYVPGFEIEGTTGRVAITEDAITLEKLQALFSSGGKFTVTGALRWLAAGRDYTLAADVKGEEVAVGPMLKALDPASAVPLEGTYALSATVAGQGVDPGAAAAGAAADLRINGKQGVLRALDLDTNKYAKAGSTVAGLVGLAGALSGNPELAKRGAQVTALNNVARQFSNLAYDEFSFAAKRGLDGAVEIGELRLLSPKLKLDGAGDLKNLPGRTFVQQPLNLKLQLGARDTLARDLATLGLLDTASTGAAAEGYAKLTDTVVLDGTLQKIGTDQLMRLLTRALSKP